MQTLTFCVLANLICPTLKNKLTAHFSDESIQSTLESKKTYFLSLALDTYKKAIEKSTDEVAGDASDPLPEESSSSSSSNTEPPLNQQQQTAVAQKSKKTEVKSQSQADATNNNNSEEWLNHYMFGKIKEKLSGSSLMECLEHYKKSFECIENEGVVHPKRLTYKNKSSSFESSEVFYRIYSVTLKRIQYLANNEQELSDLLCFLEEITHTKFVRAHSDFQLEELSQFLETNVFATSQIVASLEHRDLFCTCVCICVAGLSQVLKRFPQHYRSLYRLAHFYSKFLDFNVK